MPAKKKKGKGSKLARMSEEEKVRYLQHRAEIELEAKRRKQQLIAAFTKNKLKREEAFARLNIAKINEQWRFQLRQIKCKELYDNLEYLWKYFDTALRAKNAVIDKLHEKLNTADIDHRKLQTSHIKIMDKLINNYKMRLDKLHQCYINAIMEIKTDELYDMKRKTCILYGNCEDLQVNAYAQTISIEDKLMKTKIRNAMNTNNIEYFKQEDEVYNENVIGSEIDDLRSVLNDIISDYQKETKDKRKLYKSLVQRDIAHQDEISCFPELQSKFIHKIESLKHHEYILTLSQNKTVSELANQIEMSNTKMHALKQDINMSQTINEIQLKKQTIVNNSVISFLKKLKQKSSALKQLMKMCSNFERSLSIVHEYNICYSSDNVTDQKICCVISPYDKLEKFWQQYNYIKTENIFIKIDHNQLTIENNKLRDCLRSYLTAIARVPNVKSPNYDLI